MSASTTRTSRSPATLSEELFVAVVAVAAAAWRTVRRTFVLTFALLAGRFVALAAGFGFGFALCTGGAVTIAGGVTTTGVYVLTGA